MLLTVAAVQVPYSHSPYGPSSLSDHSPDSEFNTTSAKGHFQIPLGFRSVASAKPHRWDQSPARSESNAEEKQMSSNGAPPGPPFHEQDRERYAHESSRSTSENVLPPLGRLTQGMTMDAPPRQSPTMLPNQRPAETSDNPSLHRGPRLLGVHHILNPAHGDEDDRRSRRRATSEMQDESRANFATPISTAASGRPPSSNDFLRAAETSPPGPGGSRTVRRILTPISPRSHRITSFGRFLPGTIDAAQQPFLSQSSRLNTPDHSTNNEMPQLPPQLPQVTQHSPFILPAAPTPPLIPPHRRASVSVVGSSRPSPSPSYADSYSQNGVSGQTSPAMRPHPGTSGPTPPGSLRLTPSPRLGPLSNVPPGSLEDEQGFSGAVVSSGQNYQLLTVDTTRGHMQLPVEVQAASRMADEKRKRNAGASARFRARRKEKEREASSKISNLEWDLTCAVEDSKHYKQERDCLYEIMSHVPQYEAYLKTRPPSPRHRRALMPRPVAPPPIDSPLSTTDRYDSPEPERSVTRRRTESYPPSMPSNNPPMQHQYPPSPYTPYTPGHANHAPLPQPQQHGQHPPPMQHPQSPYAQQHPHTGSLPPPMQSRVNPAHEQSYGQNWPPRPNEHR